MKVSLSLTESKFYLKDTNQGLREVVKVAATGLVVVEVKLAPKHLHPQEREDDNKEEEEEEQRGDGANRVEERGHEVTQRGPVPTRKTKRLKKCQPTPFTVTVETAEGTRLTL